MTVIELRAEEIRSLLYRGGLFNYVVAPWNRTRNGLWLPPQVIEGLSDTQVRFLRGRVLPPRYPLNFMREEGDLMKLKLNEGVSHKGIPLEVMLVPRLLG